jgi:4'-phosphopantetheinyl transferase
MAQVDETQPTRVHPAAPAAGRSTPRQWWAGGEDGVPEGLDWLSARERARLEGVRFTKRRTEYLLRRWVGKRAVAARLGLATDEASLAGIQVLNRATGAPYVVIGGAEVGCEISLSDRAGTAVAVVGSAEHGRGALGIDLEVVEPRTAGFVTDFLTPAEQAWVTGSSAEDGGMGRDAAANLVWSAKEAALKVLRLGLRADTRWVEIGVTDEQGRDGWARFSATWRDGRILPGWWRRDGVYLLTVATERRLDPPEALAGAADLAVATPVHSWVDRPLVTPPE